MKPLLFDASGNINLAAELSQLIDAEMGSIMLDTFSDGESSIEIHSDCKNREVIILSNLSQPNQSTLPTLLISNMVREFGAKKVTLIAPYLPYMRQDSVFAEGQSMLAKHFASIISQHFDNLITVAPHLHRLFSLNQVYTTHCVIGHVGKQIADWAKQNINNPVFVGPDSESTQWVREVADETKAPYLIASKVRLNDKEVVVDLNNFGEVREHTAVIVDDIISTGGTMLQTINKLKDMGFKKIVCIGIHAIFTENSYVSLLHSAASEVITTNTLPHISNQIDVSQAIADAYKLAL